MAYGGERADVQALDQLEAVLRTIAEELAGWRTRALEAEADLREAGGAPRTPGPGKLEGDARNRVADLEVEHKVLRQRVEAARVRVHELLNRLTFLEQQAREPTGGNGGGSGPR